MQSFNVIIQCDSIAPDVPMELKAGVPSEPFDLLEGETQSFTLTINPGERIRCETTNITTGDADLYLRLGEAPNVYTGVFDCASVLLSTFESCTVRDSTDATTLWATVIAYSSVSSLNFGSASAVNVSQFDFLDAFSLKDLVSPVPRKCRLRLLS